MAPTSKVPAALRRALLGLVFVVTFLAGALRAPQIGLPHAAAAAFAEASEAVRDEQPIAGQQSEVSRVPTARLSPAPDPRAVRLRDPSFRDQHVRFAKLAITSRPASFKASSSTLSGGSACSVWRPRSQSQAELMVFLI